ncbi:NADH-quinone oxidoreductase subunit H [Candidatus Bathyarchaeota archaeon B24-2]|nr:MAG: NADH-quinone oxidoreductase subunit H [Candidatus Bathyarchaeota archaeon B24-2]
MVTSGFGRCRSSGGAIEMTEHLLTLALRVLIYPGALFLIFLAFLYEWVDRKFLARVQNRYGPLYTGPSGILQPFADFLKLLSKEDIIPAAADRLLFNLTPIAYSTLPLVALLVIPIDGGEAVLAFDGDLIFVMFLLTLIVVTVFLAGLGSMSRFSIIGGVRAALQMLGYEIPMGLALIGPAVAAGSLSITDIVRWQSTGLRWLILLQPLGFAILVCCMLAELEYVPFDIPEAETEIVAGWRTEFSGRKLALIRLGKDLEVVLASALLASLYLGGAQPLYSLPGSITFLIKTVLVVLLFTFLRGVFARFRIDQMVSGMWRYMVPLAILQVILVEFGVGR